MAESQATQAATPPAETSAPQQQADQPSQPSPLRRTSREEGAQLQQQTSARNPWSPENLAKRREALNTLRQERNVPPPRAKEESSDTKREGASSHDASRGDAQPSGESDNGMARDAGVTQPSSSTPQSTPPVSDAQMQWYQREQAVRDAELKAKDATSAVEKRVAAAEKKEAEAQAALQRLDWARSNPIEFMTEAGMSQDEWKAFLQNGGTLSPEQKRTRALEKELNDTRAQMQSFMKEQETWRLRQAADMEAAQFVNVMSNYELVTRMGGMDAVQNKRQFLEQQGRQKVSLKEAAEALEQEYHQGLSALLKDSAVRTKFGLDVNTSNAGQVATTPRTLNQKVAPQTPPARPASQKGPPDWAACRAEYLRRVEAEQRSSR